MALGVISFVTPVGNVAPTLTNGGFRAAFANTAQFSCGPGETCAPGEYRQYVMGEFTANGSLITHVLCGSAIMSPSFFQEDGCAPPRCTAYGHRSCDPSPINRYTPDQATGCEFSMWGEPGFSHVQPGVTYGINLHFRGELIDTRTNNILRSQDWTVIGRMTVPRSPFAAVAPAGLQPGDKITAVRTMQNADNSAPEVQVILRRDPAQPPIDPDSVALNLTDARGMPVILASALMVHEVAGRGSATATIVATLPRDAHAPVNAELATVGNEQAAVTMDVEVR